MLARLHFVLLVSDDNGREDYNGRNSLMLCDNNIPVNHLVKKIRTNNEKNQDFNEKIRTY